MPGLIDAHSHISRIGMFSLAGTLTIGVTSVFDPGSYLPETLDLCDAIRIGVLAGPHIYTSGPAMTAGKDAPAL